MTRSQLAIFMFLVLSWSSMASAANKADSKITQVVVFKDRANITRVKSVNLKVGASTIEFTHVTPILDRDSVRVSLKKSKGSDILGVRFKENHYLKPKNEALHRLREEERDLNRMRHKMVGKVKALHKKSEHLASMSSYYSDSFSLKIHSKKWTASDFKNFISFLGKTAKSMQGEWKKIYIAFDKNDLKLQMVRNKIAIEGQTGARQSLTVLVDVVAHSAVSSQVTLKYLVRQVGWEPSYDLRINRAKGVAELEQFANVWQNSGEEWDGVKLQLSNVRAELRPQVPAISAYSITGRKVKKVKTTISSKQEDKMSLASSMGEGSSASLGTGLAKTFDIPNRQTIKQGLSRSRVYIASANLGYKERLELVASQYKKVFRKAELTNPFAWQLARGPMNVYQDGGFLTKIVLNDVAKGATFPINGGVDHNYYVEHSFKSKVEEAGLIGSNRKYIRSSLTKITNFGKSVRPVRVYEQIPVSEIESVKVSLGKDSTKGSDKDKAYEGWVYWTVSPEPRMNQKTKAVVEVTAPESFSFSWQ